MLGMVQFGMIIAGVSHVAVMYSLFVSWACCYTGVIYGQCMETALSLIWIIHEIVSRRLHSYGKDQNAVGTAVYLWYGNGQCTTVPRVYTMGVITVYSLCTIANTLHRFKGPGISLRLVTALTSHGSFTMVWYSLSLCSYCVV